MELKGNERGFRDVAMNTLFLSMRRWAKAANSEMKPHGYSIAHVVAASFIMRTPEGRFIKFDVDDPDFEGTVLDAEPAKSKKRKKKKK